MPGFAGGFVETQKAGSQGGGDRGLSAMHAQLATGVLYVKIDGAFGKPEDAAGFPACFTHGDPLQTGEFAWGEIFGRRGHVDTS